MDYKIIAGKGFDKVKFGMKQDEVKKVLGEPTEIEKGAQLGDAADDIVDIWYYDELGLSVMFDKMVDYRLSEVDFEDENFELDGVRVGMTHLEALNAFAEAGYEDPTEEDLEEELSPEDEGTTAYSYGDKNVTLWFHDDVLDTIQIGPFWLDSDTVKWPD